MLKLIGRYFNACSQLARNQSATRVLERKIARLQREDAERHHQREAENTESARQLETLRTDFRDQFQAAVMDTAAAISKIRTPALRAVAQSMALNRYLANALPEQKSLVHQAFGSSPSPLLH